MPRWLRSVWRGWWLRLAYGPPCHHGSFGSSVGRCIPCLEEASARHNAAILREQAAHHTRRHT